MERHVWQTAMATANQGCQAKIKDGTVACGRNVTSVVEVTTLDSGVRVHLMCEQCRVAGFGYTSTEKRKRTAEFNKAQLGLPGVSLGKASSND